MAKKCLCFILDVDQGDKISSNNIFDNPHTRPGKKQKEKGKKMALISRNFYYNSKDKLNMQIRVDTVTY